MNNLYRDLAPVTEAAWEEIELEATRTFKRHVAGRRVVDVSGPGGPVTAAVSTGRLIDVASPSDGVEAHLRASKPLVRLRVPFTLSRYEIDNVERGAQDSDWDPVKAAAKKLAFVEDRAIFEGYAAASIEGIRTCSSNPPLTLPEDPREMPDVITQASDRTAAGRCRRPLFGAAVRRRLHEGQRDHRTRISDPRALEPVGRRRHHLGAGHRRRFRADDSRRRLRSAARVPMSSIGYTQP